MVDQSYLFIFLSHKDEIKDEVQKLKEGLERYGVNAFVAHSDIPAGTEWQNEILGALEDMDAFVPVLTKDFPDSPWTDQEVGYAIAKGVPIVPIRLGLDPYGFMGKFQALTCEWKDAPKEIITALTLYPSFVNTLIDTVAECSDYDTACAGPRPPGRSRETKTPPIPTPPPCPQRPAWSSGHDHRAPGCRPRLSGGPPPFHPPFWAG